MYCTITVRTIDVHLGNNNIVANSIDMYVNYFYYIVE